MNTHPFPATSPRGVGVTMALPGREVARRLGRPARAGSAASRARVRLAVLFSGNGFHSREWWAKGYRQAMELGKVLAPLSDFREKCSLFAACSTPRPLKAISTVRRRATCFRVPRWPPAAKSARAPASISSWPSSMGVRRKCRASCWAAKSRTPRSTRTTRCCTARTSRGARRPPRRRWNFIPSLAFDRLFKDEVGRGDRSVLDAVLADATDFRRASAPSDQRKLDEYLDSVREIEQRIDQAGKQGKLQGWRPTLDKPNVPRPPDGIPQNIADHMRLMCDILVLGFQTDTTRISTLKLNNDHCSLRFPHLGVDYMIHHLLSHSDTADWLKVNQFFLEQVGYIARKLDAIQEGERTPLDNSMLLFCSSMLTGSHDATKLPVVVLGGGGGRIKGGRVLDYLDKPNRKMCSLYLSMLDKCGIHLEEIRRLDGASGGNIIRRGPQQGAPPCRRCAPLDRSSEGSA